MTANSAAQTAIKNANEHPSPPPPDKAAGQFSSWLKETISVIHNRSAAAVPCAQCTACCNSAYFVHIKPSDTRTLAHIPKALTFPAPGLPKGHLLLGYDEHGRCPMYVDGGCSIYEFRPQTCRQYDCRVFAATGFGVEAQNDGAARTLIAQQAQRWAFEFSSAHDYEEFAAVQSAAKFLTAHADAFPPGFLPTSSSAQAILAIEIYALFLATETQATDKQSTAKKVQAIVQIRTRRQA